MPRNKGISTLQAIKCRTSLPIAWHYRKQIKKQKTVGLRIQISFHRVENWEHRFNHAVHRYNEIFRIQMPNITPHVCRHTYCSNQARAGMNPKTLQYLMGHSEIGVTMNTYTHLGLDDAKDEMIRLEELEQARKEIDKTSGEKPMKQIMFKAI